MGLYGEGGTWLDGCVRFEPEVSRLRMLKTLASWPGVMFNVDLHDLEGCRLCPLFLIIHRNCLTLVGPSGRAV